MHPAETSTIAHGTHSWWGSFPTDREDLRLGHWNLCLNVVCGRKRKGDV